ncbi:D-alanine/D-alanine ligase [Chloroherpeton thalassium ATCC 35110]|uniref:D-alanine--D-alanine ligase n=1 Tax=Chloroherpeton thalassium (strain ATCC 35110 / GB-78) TaxID=517418 RepID=DDL_CHLT3|nr:D-alanine--D-alanine ligase family protein [Chloroherpeton thalassium]B3QU24.1 RecName: Full=D-alanine--D-alanine ligase; AltName: Full=D-Ala-D-Ala ligase; AltName: Full=D-alanylalanine synthetase [Chloroherpeton thalassium ATCC 35110]ACF12822.1 D-alanine/D-alanine ligase [Chloroherpeton thalassium ATCC 35110]
MNKKKVALLFGGRSSEHEISVISARSIANALDKTKYKIQPIYITKAGKWLGAEASRKILAMDFESAIKSPTKKEIHLIEKEIVLLCQNSQFRFDFRTAKIDVAFPVLHGPYGEDGTVQGLLEMFDVAYVGSGVLASAITMDKAVAKICFEHAGLQVGEYLAFLRREFEENRGSVVARAEKKLRYPMFVKPANMGSSVGISKAHNRNELIEAIELALAYDRKFLIEKAINAREMEVAVLGNDEPIASAVGEVVPCNEFYDYDAKYVKGSSEVIIPAQISEAFAGKLKAAALNAFVAADCEGMARVDFLVEKETNEIYINEINSIPGFTSISMYPKLFAQVGISYTELINRLIELALERYSERKLRKI